MSSDPPARDASAADSAAVGRPASRGRPGPRVAAGPPGRTGPAETGASPAGRAPAAAADSAGATRPRPDPGDAGRPRSDPASAAEAPTGPALARAVLDAAKARRQARPAGRARRAGDPARYRRRGYSGPGADPRDPQPFGRLMEKLVRERGWQRPAAEATVFGSWERVVGPSIADHCRPVSLTDGELTVEAESTAWATQLRMLSGRILAQIAAEVRPSPVNRLRIHGPAAPSWRHGRLRVRGPGPGDTYG